MWELTLSTKCYWYFENLEHLICQYWIWIYGLLFSAKLPPALQGCLITKTTIWWLRWTRLYFRKFHHLRLGSFEYYNSARYMHTNICSWSISYSSSSAWFRLWMWFSKVLTLPAIYCTTYFPHRRVEWYSRWSPGSRIHTQWEWTLTQRVRLHIALLLSLLETLDSYMEQLPPMATHDKAVHWCWCGMDSKCENFKVKRDEGTNSDKIYIIHP